MRLKLKTINDCITAGNELRGFIKPVTKFNRMLNAAGYSHKESRRIRWNIERLISVAEQLGESLIESTIEE